MIDHETGLSPVVYNPPGLEDEREYDTATDPDTLVGDGDWRAGWVFRRPGYRGINDDGFEVRWRECKILWEAS